MKPPSLRRVPAFGILATLLVLGVAAQQGVEAGSIPGWERFVRPVMESGRNGKAFFPAKRQGTHDVEILDPRGFDVHMTNADDPGEERVVPAGAVFVPPSGRWRYWLQGEWSMTPSSLLVVSPRGGGWRGVSPTTLPVAPAGRVTVPDAVGADRNLDLWLLYAGNVPGWWRQELSRRRPISEAREGILMPAGPVVVALWDRRRERYAALGDELEVVAGRTVSAPLSSSPGEGAVLLYASLARGASPEALTGLEPTLSREGRELRPAFTVTTNWGMYRGWRGVEPGPALLSAGNELLYLDSRSIELVGGEVIGIEEALAARPLLEVTLSLPPLLREKPLTLEVRRLPGREPLARAELPRDAGRFRFQDGLVNAPLEVELATHVGPYRRQVDLTAGGEAFLALEPELIEVHGTVRLDGERHAAAVAFQTVSGQRATAEAEEDGEYRVIALQPLTWVEVRLAGMEQEPWRDFYMPPIDRSKALDFDLPNAEMTVRVIDAVTGEGIGGASVGVRNEHWPSDELAAAADARGRGTVIATSHRADERGQVRLPPPRPGKLDVYASAPGYRVPDEPLRLEVADPPPDRTVEVRLEPIDDAVSIRLSLPDGSPAAGARVARVDSLAFATTYFSDHADAQGIVKVPMEPADGLLLLKHPAAAFGIVEWRAQRNRQDDEWIFPPAADQPLTVRALDPAGEEPVARAEISLWVGDTKLSGRAMAWLLDADGVTDRHGFWRVQGLPRSPLRVLARSRHLREEAQAGRLDSLAAEIPFPWPAQVEVHTIH